VTGDLFELIRSRRSVRAYTAEALPKEELLTLIDAARWAPSAVNGQPWSFVLVTRPDIIRLLGSLTDYLVVNRHVRRAAAIIVVCADPRGSRYYRMDCAFAAQNILLGAHGLGLGACFVGAFDEEGVKEALDVPDHLRVTGLITLGRPAEEPAAPPRLAVREITRWETYSGGRAPTLARRLINAGAFSLLKRIKRRRRPASDQVSTTELTEDKGAGR